MQLDGTFVCSCLNTTSRKLLLPFNEVQICSAFANLHIFTSVTVFVYAKQTPQQCKQSKRPQVQTPHRANSPTVATSFQCFLKVSEPEVQRCGEFAHRGVTFS